MSTLGFRVDANSTIGLGHLMRCQALAQALSESGFSITFFVDVSSLPYCKMRSDWVGDIRVLSPESGGEIKSLKSELEQRSAIAIVLDGYQFDSEYRAELAELELPLIVFDDANNSGQLYADLVINSADSAQSFKYDLTAPQAILCLGAEYRILRREFLLAPDVNWPQREYLTLVFGGSDVGGLTIPCVKHLEHAKAKIPIKVITGAAYPDLSELRKIIANSSLNIEHLHNCEQMADVFTHSKLVVSAAGGSQFELLACHTPSILVIVADNQRLATEEAAKKGWCQCCQNDGGHLISTALDLWSNELKLNSMHQAAKTLADKDGARRVVQVIQELTSRS